MNLDEIDSLRKRCTFIVDELHDLIQELQDVGPSYAFFAIEAQNNLRKTEIMLMGKKKGFGICREKESDTSE